MNTEAIRIQLVRLHRRVKDLSVQTGIDYDRLQKVLHGYRRARPEEIKAIASALGLRESAISGSGEAPITTSKKV